MGKLNCVGSGVGVGHCGVGVDASEFGNEFEALIAELFGIRLSPFDEVNQKKAVSEEKFPDDVKFSFYGCTGECNHHKGVIVVASCVNNEMVEYGVAYCSPKDVYKKETGKIIAFNDMIDNRNMVALSGKKHHKINARVLADIVANADCPSWAEDKIARELARHLVYAFDVEGV